MMNSVYQEGLIRQGDDSIAVITKNGAIYREDPIEKQQEIIFHDFIAETPKTFNLSDFLDSDYHILGYEVDLAIDDDLPDNQSTIASPDYGILFEMRRIVDKKEKSRVYFSMANGRAEFGRTFLRQNEQIRLTTSVDCNSITLICKPTLLPKPINIHAS